VLDIPSPNGKGFRHFTLGTLEEVAAKALALDGAGHTVYHACAAYGKDYVERDTKDGLGTYRAVRVAENVRALRAYWIDLDCGEGKAYATQSDAVLALRSFLFEAGLPTPLLVSSGRGVHVYWPLVEEVLPTTWRPVARNLKALCAKLGLQADPARTSDTASVLRPVGTHNRKDPANPLPVSCNRDVPDNDFADFARRVKKACADHGVDTKEEQERIRALNADFATDTSNARFHAEPIAQKCAQLSALKTRGKELPEPHWYAAIEVLAFCADGPRMAKDWAAGYGGFDRAGTDGWVQAKLDQIERAGVKPTTCAHFATINPSACETCPFNGKITSPISLGQVIERAAAQAIHHEDGEIKLPDPPFPYIRGSGDTPGIYVDPGDGLPPDRIYKYDLYPDDIFLDERAGKELARWKHAQPKEGGMVDVMVHTALLHRPSEIMQELMDQHVHVLGPDVKKVIGYMDKYLSQLREQIKVRKLYDSQGWKEEGFILGRTLYSGSGQTRIQLNPSATKIATNMKAVGDRQAWVDFTAHADRPGWEQFKFVLMLGFGAPLLEITRHGGVMFNAYSQESGWGKSTAAKWMASIFGDFDKIRVSPTDTMNAKVEKLGIYKHLPFFLDEITNIEPAMLSSLAYQVSDGKGRGRLSQSSEIKDSATWNTFVLSTSNSRMHQKLGQAKEVHEAEAMRIFEFDFTKADDFLAIAPQINRFLDDNHGLVGPEYVQYLATHREELVEKVRQLVDHLTAKLQATSGERFWIAGLACALLGSLIARSLGLVKFDPQAILPWFTTQRDSLMRGVQEKRVNYDALLAGYIYDHQDQHLIVKVVPGRTNNAVLDADVMQLPVQDARGKQLTMRTEIHEETRRAVTYISQRHINEWLAEKGFDARRLKHELKQKGVITDEGKRCLGAGLGGGWTREGEKFLQVLCWVIDWSKAGGAPEGMMPE